MTAISRTTVVHYDPTAFEKLPLPGGGTVADEPRLHSVIVDQLKIPGTSHNQGRQELLQRYHNHLESVGLAAAERAKAEYLAGAQ